MCVCVCVCERERERERERQSSMVGLYSRWHNRIADWFFETDTTCTPQILQVFISCCLVIVLADWKNGTSSLFVVMKCLEQVFAVWFFG